MSEEPVTPKEVQLVLKPLDIHEKDFPAFIK